MHTGSNFQQRVNILNKEIIETLDCNLDNVDSLVKKYLDSQGLEESFAKLGNLEEAPEQD